MSTFASNAPQHVEEALALNPVEREIYLSLLGGEAWRLHRGQGLHAALLLEMFAVKETFDAFLDGIYATLRAAAVSSWYADLDALTAAVAERLRALPEADRRLFLRQENVLDRDVLERVFGVPVDDARVVTLDKLGTFMLDVLYKDEADHPAGYMQTLAAAWFVICDAAWLPAPTTVVTA